LIFVCKDAHKKNIALPIDAEKWMQDAADDLVTQMMQKYNKEKESFQYFTNVPLGSIGF
jgi:hypothetical protein